MFKSGPYDLLPEDYQISQLSTGSPEHWLPENVELFLPLHKKHNIFEQTQAKSGGFFIVQRVFLSFGNCILLQSIF